MEIHWHGLCCLELRVDEPEGVHCFRALAAAAKRARSSGLSPGATSAYRSLALYWTRPPDEPTGAELAARGLIAQELAAPHDDAGNECCISCRYDGADLAAVAEQSGLGVDAIIERHADAEWTVAAIGFTPYFPYLWGIPDALVVPRRTRPRTHVPAGSVAIADRQGGIYPQTSPGGWWLLGRCDPRVCHGLAVGDRVHFLIEDPP